MAVATYSGVTDASGNANIYRKASGTETSLILGVSGYGVDFKAWGAAATTDYFMWDNSASKVLIYRVTAEVSPGRTFYLSNKGSAMTAGNNLQGMQVSSRATGTGTIAGGTDGGEFKAGLSSDSDTGTLASARGLIGDCDAKKGTLTSAQAGLFVLNVSAGGTITTGVGVTSYMNNSGTVSSGTAFKVDAVAGYGWTYGLYMGDTIATTGIYIGNTTTGISIAGTATDGLLIGGACTDAIHISGTNTATGLHISGDQVDAILIDGDAAADNGIKIAVDDGITIGTGLNFDRTGTTGIITTAISIDTDGTTGISLAAGFTGTTGIDFAGTATTGLLISGACTNAISVTGTPTTTGILLKGGVAYNPIHIGVKSNSHSQGVILQGATDDTGGVMIFADDGNATLGSVTSPIWSRYLITAAQDGGATATGTFAQIKTQGSVTCTTGSFTALKAYNQAGTVTLVSGAEYAIINAGMTLEGNMTNTSGTASGIDININSSSYSVTSGAISALLIRKVSGSAASWTTGVNIEDSCTTTGISVGICTNAFVVAGACTGTDGWALKVGTSGAPLATTVAASAVAVYNTQSAVTGTQRLAVFDQVLTGTITTLSTTALRAHTQLSSNSVDGGAYIYGGQHKFTLGGGTINHADSRVCASLVQMDISSGTYTTGQLSALWIDCGGSGNPGAGDGQGNILRISNTTTWTPNAIMLAYAEASFLMDLGGPGGNADFIVGDGGTYSTADGYLLIKVHGSTMRIPYFSAVDGG